MGVYVFDNQIFDNWLNKKSDEILTKVDQNKISTQEMLILILKGQTNHFHHMDVEFRNEFKKIDDRFKWMIGIMVTMFLGLYLKIFFG